MSLYTNKVVIPLHVLLLYLQPMILAISNLHPNSSYYNHTHSNYHPNLLPSPHLFPSILYNLYPIMITLLSYSHYLLPSIHPYPNNGTYPHLLTHVPHIFLLMHLMVLLPCITLLMYEHPPPLLDYHENPIFLYPLCSICLLILFPFF